MRIMRWEEIIAEARAAGVLKFCADGIAVLQQVPTHHGPPRVSDPTVSEKDREQGRQSREGESQSAPEQTD